MQRTSRSILLRTVCAGGLALVLASPGQAAKLTQYWPFDDGPGSTDVANAVAGGNVGTLVNLDSTASWAADVPAKLAYSTRAIALGETNGYVNLKNIHLKDTGTVSFWIKAANYDTGDLRLFSQVPYVTPYGGLVRLDPFVSGQVQSYVRGVNWVSVGSLDGIPAGDWTHLAFVYQDGLLRLWVNGAPQSASTVTGFDFDAADFGLGARFDPTNATGGGPYGNTLTGLIDDVSVWDGPLSAESLAKLANGTRPTDIADVTPPPLAAKLAQYWPFEGTAGATEAQNAVSGGNTAYLVNSDPNTAWVTTDKPGALAYSTASVGWDGADDYVNLGNVNLKNEGTISMWIKPTAAALDASSMRPYSLLTTPASFAGVTAMGSLPSGVVLKGTVLVYNYGWQLLADGGTIQADRWTHLAFAYALGKCTLFVDGTPQMTVACGLDLNEAELGLGARFGLDGGLGGPHGTGFGGLMDDVSVWDKALQPSSIRKLAGGIAPTAVVDSPATEPPTIFTQPVGLTVVLGEPATFSVVAKGAGTLTYQWQKNETPIDGATANPYSIAAVKLTDDGNYRVVVANEFGSATSQVARLTVDPGVPVITSQPASLVKRVGAPASFTAVANGARPLNYQWYKGADAIPGATGTNYTIAAVAAGDAGDYSVVISNVSGSTSSQTARLTLVLTPAGVNVNLVRTAGANSYTGTAAAPDPGTTWNNISEALVAAAPDRTLALVDSDGTASAITFTSGKFGDPGSGRFGENGGGNRLQSTYWHVGAGNETPAFGFKNLDPAVKYDVYVYGIATDFGLGWTERINLVGGASQPLTQVPNRGWPVLNEDYALFGGVTGVTEVMFTAGEAGNGSVFSTVTGLQIIKASDAPNILTQPQSQFVRQNSSVTFGVEAKGTPPLSYQWRKNGNPLPGATSDKYTIAAVQVGDAGDYTVVVSNAVGSIASQAATLRVQTAPPAVNVNLIRELGRYEYVGTAAAPDVGTVWNQVTEDLLVADPNREMALMDSDGAAVALRFFSGSFGEPLSGWFGENGGGNAMQTTYWHVGGGKVSPAFGFRGLDPSQYYDVYVYGMQTDFGLGWGQAYTLVGGATKTVKEQPHTGFPVEGEDYVVFKGITGVSEVNLTAGKAGGYFSTVCGLQIIVGEKPVEIRLTIAKAGEAGVTIAWTGTGKLQAADAVGGPYQDVTNATNPYTVSASATRRFYRVAQ
jgi:hypothetical protein